MTGEQLNTTYSVSTADIPQTSTLRLHTKMDQNESLGVDEARTAFNGDQVSNAIWIVNGVLGIKRLTI